MSFCCWQEHSERDGGRHSERDSERRVTFHQRLPARASAVLAQMTELLHRAGSQEADVEVSWLQARAVRGD